MDTYVYTVPLAGYAWCWTRNGDPSIKALAVSGTNETMIFVEGVTTSHGQVLEKSGFRLKADDLDTFCREWLIRRASANALPVSPSQCLRCGSGNLLSDNFEQIDNSNVHQITDCQVCGARWSDRYAFADSMVVKEPH